MLLWCFVVWVDVQKEAELKHLMSNHKSETLWNDMPRIWWTNLHFRQLVMVRFRSGQGLSRRYGPVRRTRCQTVLSQSCPFIFFYQHRAPLLLLLWAWSCQSLQIWTDERRDGLTWMEMLLLFSQYRLSTLYAQIHFIPFKPTFEVWQDYIVVGK